MTPRYQMISLAVPDEILAQVCPGQFVNIKVPGCPGVFLRRPISVCDVREGLLVLLIARAGDGTNAICEAVAGSTLDVLLPLGNGFDLDSSLQGQRVLLVGGGVGVAPLLFYGKCLKDIGAQPHFLLAARNAGAFVLTDEFERIAPTYYITDDGSRGEKGFAAQSRILESDYKRIAVCGPSPMMKTVAAEARRRGISCEVSLENMMACGLGACLCCVEKTVSGHRCVCTDGPVFNTDELTWHLND